MDRKNRTRILSGLLALIMCLNSACTSKQEKNSYTTDSYIEDTNEAEVPDIARTGTVELEDTRLLPVFLECPSGTLEDIYTAIDENTNLDAKNKMYCDHFIHSLKVSYPNYDTRIFHRNISTLEIVVLSREEYLKQFPQTGVAHYDAKNNRMVLMEGYTEEVFHHELGHAAWSFYWDLGAVIVKRAKEPSSLTEAMDNLMIKAIIDPTTYTRETKILNFLMSLNANFTIEEYSYTGFRNLFDYTIEPFLEEINSIIEETLILTQKSRYEDEYDFIEDTTIIENAFTIVCRQVEMDPSLGYKPFNHFSKLLPKTEATLKTYLTKYNEVLSSKGFTPTSYDELKNRAENYSDYDIFLITKECIVPYARAIFDEDGGMEYSEEVPEEFKDILERYERDYKKASKLFVDKEEWNFNLYTTLLLNPELDLKSIAALAATNFEETDPREYSSISFTLKGEEILWCHSSDALVSIGLNGKDERGFILYKRQESTSTSSENFEEVYRSDETLVCLSQIVPFKYIVKNFPENGMEVSLDCLLDDCILYRIATENDMFFALFDNLYLNGYTPDIREPYKILVLKETATTRATSLNYAKLYPTMEDDTYLLSPAGTIINCPSTSRKIDYDTGLNLSDVLEAAGLWTNDEFLKSHLEEDDLLVFTDEELSGLIADYLSLDDIKTFSMKPQIKN